jgi:uncharacterized phage protein gp47/JayE
MPLSYPTLEQLIDTARAEFRRQLPNIDPTVFGSWSRGFIDGTGAMAHALGFVVRDLEQELFPQTATGEFLEQWGSYEDLPRNPAAGAQGLVSLNGTIATVISAGQQFTGSNDVVYTVLSPAAVEAVSLLVTSLTRSGTTATAVTPSPHRLATGMKTTISGAVETAYNGLMTVTVTGESTFTYQVAGSPTTPATGTITEASNFASLNVEAVTTGPNTNLLAGAILNVGLPNLASLAYVQFSGLGGGADLESDTDYRDRIIESRANISGVFTEDQIKIAARTISGNTRVFVKRPITALGSGTPGTPAYSPAAGQVVVIILRDNDANIIPTQSILDQTKTAIITKGRLPAHTREADVFVLAPVAQIIDFNFSAILPNTETMKTSIRNQLIAFFQDSVTFEEDIPAPSYQGAIQSTRDTVTGDRLQSFTLSTPTAAIAVADGNIPILGAVTFA